jgi:hypothetical protein
MVYLDNHLITLNAFDGTQLNGTSLSNLYFPFKGLLKDDVNILRSYVVVLNAQFPVSFYVIDATNNKLKVSELIGPSPIIITIPNGNYNATTLLNEINSQLVTVGFGDLIFSFNSRNGKISVINTLDDYTIYSDVNGSTIGTILGLSNFNINT